MADLKISQLPAATTPLAGTEVLPIVQSGTTVQTTVDSVRAGSAVLGANTFTAAQEWATGAAIASAATINLNTATGNRVHITGTTAITTVTLTRGPRTVIFDGVLTLTHNATTNNLPGAANITTAAGDRAIYESDGTTVYCVSYIPVSGKAIINPVATATTSGLVPTPPNDATKVLSGAMTYITPSTGALVLLSTVTASAAATVDLENTIDSTYDTYMVIASGFTISDAGNGVRVRYKVAGSYVETSTYVFQRLRITSDTGTYATTQAGYAAPATAISIINNIGTSAGACGSFTLYLYKPSSTTANKQIIWQSAGIASDLETSLSPGAGQNTGTGAVTGLRFSATAGTITGVFRLYGITNS